MEEFKVKKVYKNTKVPTTEYYSEPVTLPDGRVVNQQKTRTVEKEVRELETSLEIAMAKAHEAATDKYHSVSLLKEDDEFYYFQLYNPIVKESEEENVEEK